MEKFYDGLKTQTYLSIKKMALVYVTSIQNGCYSLFALG